MSKEPTDFQTLLMLKFGYRQVIKYAKELIGVTERLGFTNNQAFIDFEDELNNLSVKDHNNK